MSSSAKALAWLRILDRGAAGLRALGLCRITRAARRALGSVLRGGISVEVDGVVVTGSVDHRGYLRALMAGHGERTMARLFLASIRPGARVVDGGAYLGYYALIAARRVGSDGQVFAFEPDPRNFHWLLHNIHLNGLEDRITAVPLALSDVAGQLVFHLAGDNHSTSSLFPLPGSDRCLTVECDRLDAYLRSALGGEVDPVDVIKLDLEGAEERALRGMRSTLSAAPRHLRVFVELAPAALVCAGSSQQSLLSALRAIGPYVHLIDENADRLMPVDGYVELGRRTHVNLLCARTPMTVDDRP